MRKSSIYTKVKGRHGGGIQLSELYKGPDHFLYIRSMIRLTELYRRIPFREITGLQIIKTTNRALMNVAMLILLAIFGVLWFSAGGNLSSYFWATLCCIPLVFILINSLAGPCCRVFLFTRHRRHRLDNFQRLRHAQLFQQDLMELLELKSEEVSSEEGSEPVSLQLTDTRVPPARTGPPTPLIKIASVLFLLAALVDFFWLIWAQPHLLFVKALLMIGGLGCVVAGAIHQRRAGVNPPASLWLISSLIFYLVKAGSLYVLCIPSYFSSSFQNETSWQLWVRLIDKAQTLPLPFYVLMIVTMFVQLAFGVIGLFAYRAGREQG